MYPIGEKNKEGPAAGHRALPRRPALSETHRSVDFDLFVALGVDGDIFHDLGGRRSGGDGLHADGLRALAALLDLILDEHVLVDSSDAVGEACDVHEDVVVVVLPAQVDSRVKLETHRTA